MNLNEQTNDSIGMIEAYISFMSLLKASHKSTSKNIEICVEVTEEDSRRHIR